MCSCARLFHLTAFFLLLSYTTSDIDECAQPNVCGRNAVCRNVPETYTCECLKGYSGNPYIECKDVNECSSEGVCAPGAICINLHHCACPPGSIGDRLHSCTGVNNECLLPPQPSHGQYEWLPTECDLDSEDRSATEGVAVPTGCVLSYTCHEGYNLPSTFGDGVLNTICNNSWSPSITDIFCTKTKILGSSSHTESPEEVNSKTYTTTTGSTSLSDGLSTGCSVPQHPRNRLFCPYNCTECSLSPYNSCSYLPRNQNIQVIRIQCIPGYGLNNNMDSSVAICINQKWVPSLPECEKVCPPLDSESLHIRCFHGPTEVSCGRPMVPGTSVTYQCRQSHREYSSLIMAGVYSRTLVCKYSGTWSYSLPECEPICGVSKGNATLTPSIVDGKDTKLGVFPWHAGLFRRNTSDTENWDNICAGSLLSTRIILTAAHCVFASSPQDLKVALGKYYRSWSHQESDEVRRDVTFIKIPAEYRGAATSYTWDIALLVMNQSVHFNSFVMPVCRDVKSPFHLPKDELAYVVGWGKTSPEDSVSEILLHNTVSILDDRECKRRTSRFLSFDKFCGAKNSVSVVQKGDSGGALTVVVEGLHYVLGVVSIKWNELSLFTNVSWGAHERWIQSEIVNIDSLI